ncbi:unnamed protein product [Rotaria sp. Silwood2]|nr:unnamed protein product [Rotaria sp. Silwood2]CAF4135763.1 unnamed protein product [Rotaria sp. Silwood2]
MTFEYLNKKRRQKRIRQLLDTFRTAFWIKEHRWFVRCQWYPQSTDAYISLYTLPFVFDEFNDLCEPIEFASTCQDDRDYCSYDCVRFMKIGNEIQNFSLPPIRFPGLTYLEINLPMHTDIWSMIPTLDHLTSLTVFVQEKEEESAVSE